MRNQRPPTESAEGEKERISTDRETDSEPERQSETDGKIDGFKVYSGKGRKYVINSD